MLQYMPDMLIQNILKVEYLTEIFGKIGKNYWAQTHQLRILRMLIFH